MPSLTRLVLVVAVLVILMTTCVSMASARRMYPNRPGIPDENADGHYNDVADVATGNVVWMDAVCLANGAPPNQDCIQDGLGHWISTAAHALNGPSPSG